jgi:hypothetical protein
MAWDFIVTGWRRSGTTLFCSLLNSHSEIRCDNSSFNFFFSKEGYFDFLRDGGNGPLIESKGARLYGIKTLDPFLVPSFKYPALANNAKRSRYTGELPSFNQYSAMMERFTRQLMAAEPKVINISRHALYVYVSEQIALQRREFKFRSPYTERFAHVFDIDNFRKWFNEKRVVEARVAFLKDPARTIHVFYDDLIAESERDRVMNEVFSFLGVDPLPVRSAMKKQLPSSLRDYVLNYDEMLVQLRASELAVLAEGL